MNKHLIFVYGTLRSGAERPISNKFPGSKFIGNAAVRGSLYDLGDYPGLVANNSDSLVKGEIYEVDEETLAELDEFEATSDYCRKQVEVSSGRDSSVCWTYEPNLESYSLDRLIELGDWVEYAKTKETRRGV